MSREQKNEIARTLCVRYGSCHECPSFPTCVVETFADRICEADYRKQSEGEWTYDYTGDYLDGTDASLSYKCSLCGEYATDPFSYCPNCGAKMKGGAE